METSRGMDIKYDSDSSMVAAVKLGDMRAFEELVLRHRKRVLAVAQRITKNREDAEDVAQECFHKVFLHLGDFQEKSRFSTWLTRIAMNEAFMLLRRKRGNVEVLPAGPDDDAKSTSERFVDLGPSPEESCWRRECIDLLTKAINRLSPNVRTAVVLCEIEELTAKETAEVLGASVTAVKSRIFHGRRKLQTVLSDGFIGGLYSPRGAEAQRS
jgi:RNA polymerase sigma-70 factor, ECF subfamily